MARRRFSRPRRRRILLLMTPAKATILNDALVPRREMLRASSNRAMADDSADIIILSGPRQQARQ